VHPIVILAPTVALLFGPRIWVQRVLKQHDRLDLPGDLSARDLARELLDRHWLQIVKVQSTDGGDHYDPVAKAVRLSRDKIDRKTLTALTTAAHEVSHAIQDASGYGPFVWRTRLVKVAQGAGEIGAVLFLSMPVAAIFFRRRVPPIVIGVAALSMLGTGMIAQLAALPSELDASFGRALPMLRERYVNERQGQDARKILLACSLTYIASSMVSVLHIWPWIGLRMRPQPVRGAGLTAQTRRLPRKQPPAAVGTQALGGGTINPVSAWADDGILRRCAKSLIRGWLRLSSGF